MKALYISMYVNNWMYSLNTRNWRKDLLTLRNKLGLFLGCMTTSILHILQMLLPLYIHMTRRLDILQPTRRFTNHHNDSYLTVNIPNIINRN